MSFAPVYIESYDCLTPAGQGISVLLRSLGEGRTYLGSGLGSLPTDLNLILGKLREEKSLKHQDKVSLMGVLLARKFKNLDPASGVIVGSSRGAAESIENSIRDYFAGKRVKPSTSPVTTASGLTAAIARDRMLSGPTFTLSAACSTGLYAIIQGAASINVGLARNFLVGGIEAANTKFSREMMAATKVLSLSPDAFPCKPGAKQRSGMVLSEGAAMLYLSDESTDALAAVVGIGAATEASSLTGVTVEGLALQTAIKRCLDSAALSANAIDLIVGHGAGTLKGDQAEINAYDHVFIDKMPPLVFHKWCGGHMLGASAALSVMLAIEHLRNSETPPHPYFESDHPLLTKCQLGKNRYALVTSMGFGGSACAVLVKNLIP